MNQIGLIFSLILSFSTIELTSAQLYFEDLETLNPAQKSSLQKLKTSVSKILPHDWMKEDIYLVKYLQATNFNAKKAEDMIKETIKFRKEAKVDEWDDPAFFAEFEASGKYPIYYNGWDRAGRPIVEAFFGDWDVRPLALAGKIKQLTYYTLHGIEKGTRQVRELQGEGKNVTDWVLLLNMDGFNLKNQACPVCLPFYLGFLTHLQKYWTHCIKHLILANTPESFELILNLVRPTMSPHARKVLKVFGTNKSEWKPYLDEIIDPTEISDWYDPRGKQRSSS